MSCRQSDLCCRQPHLLCNSARAVWWWNMQPAIMSVKGSQCQQQSRCAHLLDIWISVVTVSLLLSFVILTLSPRTPAARTHNVKSHSSSNDKTVAKARWLMAQTGPDSCISSCSLQADMQHCRQESTKVLSLTGSNPSG